MAHGDGGSDAPGGIAARGIREVDVTVGVIQDGRGLLRRCALRGHVAGAAIGIAAEDDPPEPAADDLANRLDDGADARAGALAAAAFLKEHGDLQE